MNSNKIELTYEKTKDNVEVFSFEDNYMEKCYISQNPTLRNSPPTLNIGLVTPTIKIDIYRTPFQVKPLTQKVAIEIPSGWTIRTHPVLSKEHLIMILPIFQSFIDTGGFDEKSVNPTYLISNSETYEDPQLEFEKTEGGEVNWFVFSFDDYDQERCHIRYFQSPSLPPRAQDNLKIQIDQSQIKVKVHDPKYYSLFGIGDTEIISLPPNWEVNNTLNFNKERLSMIMPIFQRFIDTDKISP